MTGDRRRCRTSRFDVSVFNKDKFRSTFDDSVFCNVDIRSTFDVWVFNKDKFRSPFNVSPFWRAEIRSTFDVPTFWKAENRSTFDVTTVWKAEIRSAPDCSVSTFKLAKFSSAFASTCSLLTFEQKNVWLEFSVGRSKLIKLSAAFDFNVSTFNVSTFNVSTFNVSTFNVSTFNVSTFNVSTFNVSTFNSGSVKGFPVLNNLSSGTTPMFLRNGEFDSELEVSIFLAKETDDDADCCLSNLEVQSETTLETF